MRWALADAGDALDDANFETTTANAAILRLTKELAWIEDVLLPGAGAGVGTKVSCLVQLGAWIPCSTRAACHLPGS